MIIIFFSFFLLDERRNAMRRSGVSFELHVCTCRARCPRCAYSVSMFICSFGFCCCCFCNTSWHLCFPFSCSVRSSTWALVLHRQAQTADAFKSHTDHGVSRVCARTPFKNRTALAWRFALFLCHRFVLWSNCTHTHMLVAQIRLLCGACAVFRSFETVRNLKWTAYAVRARATTTKLSK